MAPFTYKIQDILNRFADSERLELYFDQLEVWNSKINLVSRETVRDDWRRLAAESLVPLAILEDDASLGGLKSSWRLYLDIGSGGGFPAVPLALSGRIGRTVCLDSVGKKAGALNEMLHELTVDGEARQVRLEEWKTVERFDLVTMRLVALDIRLWKAIHRLVASDGLFIYYSHPKFDFKPSRFHVKQRTFTLDDSTVVKQLTYVFR